MRLCPIKSSCEGFMRLNEKILICIVLFFIVIISLISLFGSFFFLTGYSRIDEQDVGYRTGNAVIFLSLSQDNLVRLLNDWAPWDDTYQFVKSSGKTDYVENNLNPDTFRIIHIDLFAVTDLTGNVVYGRVYDKTHNTLLPLTPEILSHINSINGEMSGPRLEETKSGIVSLDNGFMLIGSGPVLRTNLSGPVAGRLFMGSYLGDEDTARIASVSSPGLKFLQPGDSRIPPQIRDRLVSMPQLQPLTVIRNDTTIDGFLLVNDIYGNPALVLYVEQARSFYQQGKAALISVILLELGIALFFGILILMLLDRFVLRRLRLLKDAADEITKSDTLTGHIELGGDDEIADVAHALDLMIERIQKGQLKLEKSESRFRELADLLPQIIFEMDAEGKLTYVNRYGRKLFGVPLENEVGGLNALSYLVPGDRESAKENLERLLSGNKPFGGVYNLQLPEGRTMIGLIYAAPIIRGGRFEGFRGSLIDITEMKNLERALTDSKKYLEEIFTSVQAGILIIDAMTHRIIDLNPTAAAIIGAPKDQVVGKICHKFICPTQYGGCPITDLGQEVDNQERLLFRTDGSMIPIIKHVVRITLDNQDCLLETFIDNSERKKMEVKLKESEEKYRNLAEKTADILFSLDVRGTITYVSPQITRYGYNPEDLLHSSYLPLIYPEDRERLKRTFAGEMLTGNNVFSTFRIFDRKGSIHWVEENSTILIDENNKPCGLQGVIRDVTDRKKAEDAIRLANRKLNLLNDITRHDIINTLTGLLGSIDMAQHAGSDREKTQYLEDIKQLARKIQVQIEFTREYQAVGVNEPRWQNVRGIIQACRTTFSDSPVTIINDFTDVEVFADPMVEKVFYNLIQNAIKYGENTTTIRFFEKISGHSLSIVCEDDGAGIPFSMKKPIFERGIGQHTGMGLFLSREILGITGIAIEETGIPGRGARFEITIPEGMFRIG
jgi:PAS domain S-box-containing protein